MSKLRQTKQQQLSRSRSSQQLSCCVVHSIALPVRHPEHQPPEAASILRDGCATSFKALGSLCACLMPEFRDHELVLVPVVARLVSTHNHGGGSLGSEVGTLFDGEFGP